MKDQTQEFEAKFPTKDFNKSVYSFDSSELRKLSSFDTIVQMGQLAETLISKTINDECMVRVGAKNSPDVGILYDIPRGQFIIFTPKVWCTACKVRKADFEYKGRYYCNGCLEIQKVADAGKEKVKEVKKK